MRTPLTLSEQEWENLCDGCGRCCMVKLEDEDTGELHYTNVACRYLDLNTCRCTEYKNRARKNPDCMVLNRHKPELLSLLPTTCAYRLFDQDSKVDAPWEQLSVKGKVVSQEYIHSAQLPEHIVDWIKAF